MLACRHGYRVDTEEMENKMAREKVVTPYFIGGGFGVTKYWVARFANEGADALAGYIVGLRTQYAEARAARCDEEMAEVAKAGKYAKAIYEKHFGAFA